MLRPSAAAAPLVLLSLTLPCAALISGCHRRFGILDIPVAFQGTGVADAQFGDYVLRGNLSVVANGLRLWGASLISDGPTAGVLTTLCVQSSSSAPAIPNLAAFELAAETSDKESSTLCIAALINATNTSRHGLYFDVFQPGTLEHLEPCKASKLRSLPATLVAESYDAHAPGAPELCPWGGALIPLELVQPLANATAELPLGGGGRRKTFAVREGFSLEGWVRESFDGQARATACALTVTALPANRSGLPGADSLWEIGFGDALVAERERSSCGWWARVGRDLVFTAWNSSAVHRSACPTTLGGGVPTRTLVDYFPVPPPPSDSRSQHPTRSPSRSPHAERTRTSSQAATPSGTGSQAATPPPSPSAPPTPSPSPSPPPYVFTVGELSGGAAIAVVVAVSLGGAGLVALAVLALLAWRRHAIAMAAAAAGAGVGPDGRRSAQTAGGGDYYKAFPGEPREPPLLSRATGAVN